MRSLVFTAVLLLARLAPAAEGPPLEVWLKAALEHNPRQDVSRARRLTAEADRLQAGSALLPTLRAQGSYVRNQYETVVVFPDPATGELQEYEIAPRDTAQALVSLRVPLVDPPGFARWRASRRGAEAAGAEFVADEQVLLLDVARTYYAAVAAKQVLLAAERALEVAKENARIVNARLKAGAVTPLFADRAELEVTRAEQVAIEAKRGWEAARRVLASATGLAEPDALPSPAPSMASPPPEATLLEKARAQRPELVAATERVAEARGQKQAAWLAYAPSLFAQANERWTNASGFVGREASWDVGLVAEWAVLDFGTRSAELKRERAEVLRTLAELRQRQLDVADEVHEAWLDVEAARAKLVSTRRGEEVSQRAAQEMRARFTAGTITQLDIIQSERDTLQAAVDRIRAEAELAVAWLALDRATGTALLSAETR